MFIITRFLIFCANLYILTYIYLLKKNYCECSEDWRRDFIKVYSILVIVLICAGFFLDTKKLLKNDTVLGFLTLVQLAGFIYLYCLLSYIYELVFMFFSYIY